MQPPVRDWLDTMLVGFAALQVALGESDPDVKAGRGRATFAAVLDVAPVAPDDPGPERLAAVRCVALRLRGRITPAWRPMCDAILAACDAAEADDGSPEALARFRRAEAEAGLAGARQEMRDARAAAALWREPRGGAGRGARHPLIEGVLLGAALARRAVDQSRGAPAAAAPGDDGPALLAWLRARSEADAPDARDAGMVAFLDAVEADDGSEAAWERLLRTLGEHHMDSARARLEAAEAAARVLGATTPPAAPPKLLS